jgi:Transposase DDE domain
MIAQVSPLVTLVQLVDRLPRPAPPTQRGRGRPRVYTDPLFLKALVIMIVRRLHSPGELLAVLQQPTDEMQRLRQLLTEGGRFPSRRTWERRLAALPATLPAQIGCLGRHLVSRIKPWGQHGRAAAIDSTALRAKGGVWHKKHRDAGVVPHTSIDTEAGWTKSGWHGWVYGWKLHLICSAGDVWIPLAAELTAANTGDNTQAPDLVRQMPGEVHLLLGDQQYRDPALEELCQQRDCFLVTPKSGRYPHRDAGVEVRRVLHKLRSITIENFNEQFKAIFGLHGPVPTRGYLATRRWALGAIFVYQLILLERAHQGADLRVGLKAFLKAA